MIIFLENHTTFTSKDIFQNTYSTEFFDWSLSLRPSSKADFNDSLQMFQQNSTQEQSFFFNRGRNKNFALKVDLFQILQPKFVASIINKNLSFMFTMDQYWKNLTFTYNCLSYSKYTTVTWFREQVFFYCTRIHRQFLLAKFRLRCHILYQDFHSVIF